MRKKKRERVAHSDNWNEFLKEFQGESDRAAAVLGAAFLDIHLERLLESFFVEGHPKITSEVLDRGSAGTFAARIKMALCLGLLTEEEYADLELIREIRNAFAHDLQGVAFSNNEIEKAPPPPQQIWPVRNAS